jgi:hypothetical protein
VASVVVAAFVDFVLFVVGQGDAAVIFVAVAVVFGP